ncbi:uncharacterized protein At4g00950 [Mercurialis annua]|uniref:uncharacterized protein At4g00950 n=1 Tax=Mercurialis annua TaxID=3986 RepID=UPI00215EBE22|nr:uncharacterized protein At4g00950 [Mercurialis annua]
MGSVAEAEAADSCTPRLPLLSKPVVYMQSPQRSGMVTPPLYSSAAVPFRWEEEPGKPRERLTTAGSTSPVELSPKSLELPPRMFLENNSSKLTPSPTTVLDGPYISKSSRFQSSSFRMIRRERYGSFRGVSFGPERGDQLGDLVLSKQGIVKDRSLWGSWRWGRRGIKGKRDVGGASYVFPSLSMEDRELEYSNEEEEVLTSNTLSSHTRSHFWATIYEGLKQVVPWRSRKVKKEGLLI